MDCEGKFTYITDFFEKPQTVKDEKSPPPSPPASKHPADYETAIKATGFGRFNILLLLATFPAMMAGVIETAVISFILPSAECDLDLSLMDKGILNAITSCGMIVSSLGWGYLADTKGRKGIMVWGCLSNVIFILWAAMSQSRIQLMIAKFFSGFIICGPFSVLVPYITEFHGCDYRSRIMMIFGTLISAAAIMLPVMALLILPNDWNFAFRNMEFTSWRIYLAVCGIPCLLGGLILLAFPETPRFLMTKGRNEEALEVFKTMYSMNTKSPKETYPISKLQNDFNTHPTKNDNMAVTGIKEINITEKVPLEENQKGPFKLLFSQPFISLTIRVFLLKFFMLLGKNTLRLWLPQLFASLNEYKQISSDVTSLCTILEYSVNKTEITTNPQEVCTVIITPSTYTNNIVVSCVVCVAFIAAGTLINKVGDKIMQVFTLSICGICGLTLYWSSSSTTTLIITSTYISMGTIAMTALIGTCVNLFPTSSRTIIVSASMSCGLIGTILGNVLFPIFMSVGCIPPIAMLGGVMFFSAILAYSLPSTKKTELK
ncbi:synaptic vesicle glycoprotein 2C-like [Musca vetustissima]|uniref:synaptic vesicle glycoprotein 2C-like n=1 Tax=Musca vetustissima TaxID=27455 RepID=UPI002AB6450D|nr:synaptic vesicle glycoprotein 2C-like [Musca vetustissima]